MFRQVCYSSSASSSATYSQLPDILNAARTANGPAGVTGLLAAGGGLFFQVLEGEAAAVEAALEKIKADPRHRNIRILQDEMVEERAFTGCPMGFRALEPDALHMIAARTRSGHVPVGEMVAVLGDPAAAARMQRLPLAA